MNVILTIDKVYTAPQWALDFRSGLGGLNQVYGPILPLFRVSVAYIFIDENVPLFNKFPLFVPKSTKTKFSGF